MILHCHNGIWLICRRHGRMKVVPRVCLRSHRWIMDLQRSEQIYGRGDYRLHAGLGSMSVPWLCQICGEEDTPVLTNSRIGNGTPHIPHSTCLPYSDVLVITTLQACTRRLKALTRMRKMIKPWEWIYRQKSLLRMKRYVRPSPRGYG